MNEDDKIYYEFSKNLNNIYNLLKVASPIESLSWAKAGYNLEKPFKLVFDRNNKEHKMHWENLIKNNDMYTASSSLNKKVAYSLSKCFYTSLAKQGRVKSSQLAKFNEVAQKSGHNFFMNWDSEISQTMYDAAIHHEKEESHHHHQVKNNDEEEMGYHLTAGNQDFRQVDLKAQGIDTEDYILFIERKMNDIFKKYKTKNLEEIRKIISENLSSNNLYGKEEENIKNEIAIIYAYPSIKDLKNQKKEHPRLTARKLYRKQRELNMITPQEASLRRRSLNQAFDEKKDKNGRFKIYLTYEFEDDAEKLKQGFDGLKKAVKNIIVNLSNKKFLDSLDEHISLKTSATAENIVMHLDTIVIYFYSEQDRAKALKKLEQLIPMINSAIDGDSSLSGRLLSPSERENTYIRSTLGNDIKTDPNKRGESDTSAFCNVAAVYITTNLNYLCKGLREVKKFEDFVYKICKNLEPLYKQRWVNLSYNEKVQVSIKASNYLGS